MGLQIPSGASVWTSRTGLIVSREHSWESATCIGDVECFWRAILAWVFELTISTTFSAAHALEIQGVREPVHGHDWHVEASILGAELDQDGLLCDFHVLEDRLEAIVAPFQTADLNAAEAFGGQNPSAEVVAHHIGTRLAEELPEGIQLRRLSVTEAPNCKAAWLPE